MAANHTIRRLAAYATGVITISGLALWQIPGYIESVASKKAEDRVAEIIAKLQPSAEFTTMKNDIIYIKGEVGEVKITVNDFHTLFTNYLIEQAKP